MRRILAVSQDAALLITRTEVLRRANAGVIPAKAEDAKKLLKTQHFDLSSCVTA
jgi:hypothetical protein